MRPNQLQAIKQKQLTETPEIYLQSHIETPVDLSISTLNVSGNNLLEQLQAAMAVDLARIKDCDTIEAKAAVKSELLLNYLPFVNAYVEKGQDTPNSVAVWVMIWLFDVGNIEKALELGLWLVKTGTQVMPSQFGSSLETFICDYTYDYAEKQLKAEQSASPYLDELVSTMQVDQWQLNDIVESKMYAMFAKHYFRTGDDENCVAMCELAEKAHRAGEAGAGVKGLKKKAQKQTDETKQKTEE